MKDECDYGKPQHVLPGQVYGWCVSKVPDYEGWGFLYWKIREKMCVIRCNANRQCECTSLDSVQWEEEGIGTDVLVMEKSNENRTKYRSFADLPSTKAVHSKYE